MSPRRLLYASFDTEPLPPRHEQLARRRSSWPTRTPAGHRLRALVRVVRADCLWVSPLMASCLYVLCFGLWAGRAGPPPGAPGAGEGGIESTV